MKLMIATLFLFPISAQAGERSMVLPMNAAKAYLAAQSAITLVPGPAQEYTEFSKLDFRGTHFSSHPSTLPGYTVEVELLVDDAYRCAARVVVAENGAVLDSRSVGKVLCGRVN